MSHQLTEIEPSQPRMEAAAVPSTPRLQNARPQRTASQDFTAVQWMGAFMAALGSGLYVQIIGYLSFLEIFLLVTLPGGVNRVIKSASLPGARMFTVLWLLWIVGQIISDLANANDFGFAARGFAKAFFSGFVTLVLLPSMLRHPRSFEAFLAGLPLAHLIGSRYFRSGALIRQDGKGWMASADLGWDTYWGYLVTLCLAYLVARFWRSSPWLCVAGTFAIGLLHIVMGSRSTGLYHILAACMMPLVLDVTRTSARSSLQRARWSAALPWGRFIAAAGIVIVAAMQVKDFYEYHAPRGDFGEKARQKYEMQSKYANLIVGARQGPFIGIAAALDKPILGHGSWARMDKDYVASASELFGVEMHREKGFNYHSVFIPAHSMIIAAWVEGGVLGLVFWVFAFGFAARYLARAVLTFPEYAGVLLINTMGFFWSVWFSPIQTRSYTAIIFVPLLAAVVLHLREKRTRQAQAAIAVRRPLAIAG
jgi:hypothetical protein